MRPRRSLLYVPGDDLHKIQKAASLGDPTTHHTDALGVQASDCICLDLEDGVAWSQKAAARRLIQQALASIRFGSAERLVRVCAASSGNQEMDLQAALFAHPDGIILPKAADREEIRHVSRVIADEERRNGWDAGSIALIAIIESARGVIALGEIAGADPRLQALALGAEDLAADLGATRTRTGWEMFYARSALVTQAAAHGLQALDMVFTSLEDLAGLAHEAQQGAGLGFSGKQVIHPRQIPTVLKAFTPDPESIAHARRLVQAYEEQLAAGKNVFVLDGKMIEAPNVQAAKRMLVKAGLDPADSEN